MKILITGVHGFVGSNLVETLKKEHTIYDVPMVYGFMWGNIMALIGTAVVITLSLFFFGHIITLFLTMIMFTAIMAMMD